MKISREKILFIIVFIILGTIALQIPINILAGAKVKFTLFDLFAPISGAFLGSAVGVAAVVSMQIVNLMLHGFGGVGTDSFIKLLATFRFLPLIFGVLYFSLGNRRKNRLMLIAPIVSIVAFNMHPIGRSVWFYSLYWLIPVLVWPLRERFLLAKALGSTFCAHAVGGAVWIWAFNLPATVWISLIPTVALERLIFALGISASYILMNNVLAIISSTNILPKSVDFDRKYVLRTLNSKL